MTVSTSARTIAAAATSVPAKRCQSVPLCWAAALELEIDEFIIRIIADPEQDDHEKDREADGDPAARRKPVHEGPGRGAEHGDKRCDQDRPPLDRRIRAAKADQTLINPQRRLEARGTEEH